MNRIIEQYFDRFELRLIQSPVVVSYEIRRRDIAPGDGKLRIKASLIDGGIIGLFVYVTETGGRIDVSKYSFHWQDANGNLKQRWDNAPHHPKLPGAPHHVHYDDDTLQGAKTIPSLFSVITHIEETLLKK